MKRIKVRLSENEVTTAVYFHSQADVIAMETLWIDHDTECMD